MPITVSELVVRFLSRLGIDVVFGMPGAHILPVYDSLRAAALKTVLVKHEQGAAFMAGGFARAAHRPAACIATAGPGAANLITGIANAWAERLPVLAITGETPTYLFGKGGLQESSGEGGAIDQAALFAGITRYSRLVERTDYLAQVLNQAARALLGPEPGPVLLALPYNVQKESVDEAALDALPAPDAQPAVDARAIPGVAELAALLRESRAPVIIAGHGCIRAGARAQLARLAETARIPVASSLKAKGVVCESSPWALGCLGVTSDGRAYRHIVEHADALIFLGAGFNERTSYLWDAKLLSGKRLAQVDIDPAQLGKVFKPDLAVRGDLGAVLQGLLDALAENPRVARNAAPEADARAATSSADPDDCRFSLMAAFYRRLAEHFPRDALVFDDNIIFAQSYYPVSAANHYFPNTGISSLGHAIPAAIGAHFHAPRAPLFAILGDGGFQMCGMELMTAVNYRVPLNTVVINNGGMSLIRKNQYQLYGERYIDCDFINPDFALLAAAFGLRHYRVESEADLDPLFNAGQLAAGGNLIEILLDKHAFPSYLSAR